MATNILSFIHTGSQLESVLVPKHHKFVRQQALRSSGLLPEGLLQHRAPAESFDEIKLLASLLSKTAYHYRLSELSRRLLASQFKPQPATQLHCPNAKPAILFV